MQGKYDNTNRGALFKNDRREKDTHPEYKGSINVDGEEYWLSAWVKTSNSGQKFFSLTVQAKNTKSVPLPKPRSIIQEDNPVDDDIPF